MSEIKKTVDIAAVPARQEARTIGARCDLCGRETSQVPSFNGELYWPSGGADDDWVTVTHSTGLSYCDGGHKHYTSYHVCPACWQTRIVPVFAGVPPTVLDVDW